VWAAPAPARPRPGRLLGDVASVVVRRAHCDVLVIRPVNPDEGDQIRPESDA